MTPLKQALLSIIILAAAAGGWEAFQHRDQLFGQNGGTAIATSGKGGTSGPDQSRGSAVNVVAAPVIAATIGDELRAIGTAASVKATTLFPQSAGLIDKIYVGSGAHVEEGTVLVRLDNQSETIALDKAKITLADAQKAFDRAGQLAKTQNGTQVDLSNSESTLAKAKTDLDTVQLALDRRSIIAPFAGTIGFTTHVAGDLVTSATPIATLDDLSAFTVTFDASQRFAGLVKLGAPLTATAEGLPGETIKGAVSAVDTRVDETTRAFKVRATLTEGIAGLKPGMATVVAVAFPGVPKATVPSSAVLWDREGSYVWKVSGNIARRTPVGILGRRGGTVILSGDLKDGDKVAVEGLQRLRDGIAVAGMDGSTAGGEPGGDAGTSRAKAALPSPAS